jgi:hypothetical protein
LCVAGTCLCSPLQGYGGSACDQCAPGFGSDGAGGCVKYEAVSLPVVDDHKESGGLVVGSTLFYVIVGGGIGGLLVIASMITVVVMKRRRGRNMRDKQYRPKSPPKGKGGPTRVDVSPRNPAHFASVEDMQEPSHVPPPVSLDVGAVMLNRTQGSDAGTVNIDIPGIASTSDVSPQSLPPVRPARVVSWRRPAGVTPQLSSPPSHVPEHVSLSRGYRARQVAQQIAGSSPHAPRTQRPLPARRAGHRIVRPDGDSEISFF